MNKVFIFVSFLAYICAAGAQSLPDSQRIIEQAYAKAMGNFKNQKDNPPTRTLPEHDNRGVDPLEIAKNFNERYEDIKPSNLSDSLTIYISTSMPKGSLLRLAQQAKEIGATLALRGLVVPLGTPKAIEKTILAIEPYGVTGVSIQIDPEGFKKHGITAVPTFVIAKPTESCDEKDSCEATMTLSGDVSIQYALEHWEAMGGRFRQRSLPFLNKMKAINE